MEVCNLETPIVPLDPKGGEVYHYINRGSTYHNTYWLVVIIDDTPRFASIKDGALWNKTRICILRYEKNFIKVNAYLQLKEI